MGVKSLPGTKAPTKAKAQVRTKTLAGAEAQVVSSHCQELSLKSEVPKP